MISPEERANVNTFRKLIHDYSDLINESLEFIKKYCYLIGSSNMHNVVIMYNNKMSEILHTYYEHDMEFFDDHLASDIIYEYLSYGVDECFKTLDEIINYIKAHRIFYPTRNKYLEELIEKYISISEDMYSFDLKENFGKALYTYSILKVGDGITLDEEEVKEAIIPDLKALGVKHDNIDESIFTPKGYLQQVLKSLSLVSQKDIRK